MPEGICWGGPLHGQLVSERGHFVIEQRPDIPFRAMPLPLGPIRRTIAKVLRIKTADEFAPLPTVHTRYEFREIAVRHRRYGVFLVDGKIPDNLDALLGYLRAVNAPMRDMDPEADVPYDLRRDYKMREALKRRD